jgi:hypothetical protein
VEDIAWKVKTLRIIWLRLCALFRRAVGWTEAIKENCREQRGLVWLETWYRDCLYGARMLLKNPGFTAPVVLTLALRLRA